MRTYKTTQFKKFITGKKLCLSPTARFRAMTNHAMKLERELKQLYKSAQ